MTFGRGGMHDCGNGEGRAPPRSRLGGGHLGLGRDACTLHLFMLVDAVRIAASLGSRTLRMFACSSSRPQAMRIRLRARDAPTAVKRPLSITHMID